MASYMGLYYPFMEFSDDAWVKLAALYWEKLGRIVPKGYTPRYDSTTVKQLTDELDFVKNFYPTVRNLETVSDMFLEVLNKHQKALVRYYGINARSFDDLPREALVPSDIEEEERLLRSEYLPKLRRDKREADFAIGGKMAARMRTALEKEELLKTIEEDNKILDQILAHEGDIQKQQRLLEKHSQYSWFFSQVEHELKPSKSRLLYDGRLLYAPVATEEGRRIIIHPKLAFIYMEVLADVMALDRQLHLVTDDTFSYVATSGYTVERLLQALLPSNDAKPHIIRPLPKAHEIEAQMATIALQSVVPRNLADIPAKKIIRFRNRYRDEMIAFQDAILALAKDLEQLHEIDDVDAFKAHLEIAYERTFKPQFNDFKKSLNSLGIDTAMGVVNVKVALPALLASTISSTSAYLHLAPLNPIIVGAGAVACSIFPVIRKKQEEARKMVRSSPVAYLLYAQEELEPTKAVPWITQQVRKFIFHV